MRKYLVTSIITISFVFSSIYDVGDFINDTHQNITKSTCYAGNDYDVGDNWRLADWNGAANGGHYTVIFIDMAATWWPSCWTGHNGPAGEVHHDYEDNDHVKFLNALSDLNQPYSCNQWGNAPDGGGSHIVHDTGYDIWELFESQSAFPSTVWINHEMQVYDQMNNAGSWSVGSRIDQMLEDCGSLCEDGGCATAFGDVNEDEIINIQDLITMVNHILGSSLLMDCSLEAADINTDGIVNIQDLISLVNAILGSARSADLDGHADIEYIISTEDLILNITSDIDLAGIQLSMINNSPLVIELKDNSHITQSSNYQNGITKYLAYSMFNQPFDSRTTEILIKSGANIDMDDLQITVADINGDVLYVSHVKEGKKYRTGPHSFELSKLYPNPFNPSTQVAFSLPMDSHVRLVAYNIGGQEVDVIFEGSQSAGYHSYTWNASNFPSGVYYIKLQADDMVSSQKALLIK